MTDQTGWSPTVMVCRTLTHDWKRRSLAHRLQGLLRRPQRTPCRRCGCVRAVDPDGSRTYTYPPGVKA